jgi:hypothetical protein
MMKAVIKIIGAVIAVLVVAIAAVFAYASTRPDTFRVERTTAIKAPPEKIFPLINDLQSHRLWSPWEKKDPGMKRSYSGPASGKGAAYAWDGNDDIGAGRMEITESSPPWKVVLKLDFIRPFEASNTAEFVLRPNGDITFVTWAMYGPSPLITKVMDLLVGIDSMVGQEFEAGLASLKALAEKQG